MNKLLLLACALLCSPFAFAQDTDSNTWIRLPRNPVMAPDGTAFAFAWQKDIWTASIDGGTAHRLTVHGADDDRPLYSPDGQKILFRSDRSGGNQLYVMPSAGGAARQITFTSHQDTPLGFTADGSGVLISRSTDRGYHYSESRRVYEIKLEGQAPPRLLLDVGLSDADLSPDGKTLLFTRGRGAWYRKGYKGPQALQLWTANLAASPPTLRRVDADQKDFQNVSHLFPTWAPDGKSYFFVSDPKGTFNVFQQSLDDLTPRRITDFTARDGSDDGAVFLSLSADGRTMLMRRRFDLMKLDLSNETLSPITLKAGGDGIASPLEHKVEKKTRDIAFTQDGKQMAYVAGQDIYVMDRILKEPVQVTNTPAVESDLAFSLDGKTLYYVSEAGGEVDIWQASHTQEAGIWWMAKDFEHKALTDDAQVERRLAVCPKGDKLAYVRGTHIYTMNGDGSDAREVVPAWSLPDFGWSPDGQWLTYATQDDDYNSDVFVVPVDGSREPFNLSRHPDGDYNPVWSGDGKRLAFTSQRAGDEMDVYYINLTKEEDESTERDRKLKEALEAMEDKKKGKDGKKKKGGNKSKGSGDTPEEPGPDDPAVDPNSEPGAGEPESTDGPSESPDGDSEEKAEEDTDEPLVIDFDGIHDRIHRISIPNSYERSLSWSPDGNKLVFQATVKSKSAVYQLEFPKAEKPAHFSDTQLGSAMWLPDSKQIVGQADGRPASVSNKGKAEYFDFSVRWIRDWRAVRAIAFDQAWRAMRDRFYDPQLNHRDWNQIRATYRPVAQQCLGQGEFTHLMNMMLGELNASHMGHRGGGEPLPENPNEDAWQPTTYQLGLRYSLDHTGPGLRVESVIPGSACHRARSQVLVGETLTHLDGTALDASVDLDRLLTMDQVRDVELTVLDAAGEARQVTVRPTSSVRGLLYDEFAEANRAKVEEWSNGKLGYLHIRGMNMGSFRKMEEDLFAAGHGKDGLLIDVRFNGGGSTADHVLTALTQPVHAITQSRGSGEGYPQGRKVYASWSKPIVVLCNEHSFSNAEILSHAIKQIGRGTLVGMRTAGGVISTSSVGLLDGSSARMPMRGWYLIDTGQDMELNGCLPHIPLWNQPDGPDDQLAQAVSSLAATVQKLAQEPQLPLVPAADLRAK
ncbi:MAG: S41 family peptidase [Planctomycetota bacterium]|nr:S41 family peptidase [Planctomycetota bacterium]